MPRAEAPDPLVGGRIGNCRIEKRAAAGLYEARRLTDDEAVLVKIILPEQADDAGAMNRFFLEADTGRKISHERVLKVLDSGTHDGRLFIVLEYVRGERLDELMKRDSRINFEKATRIAREIAEGLQALHEAGISHRDLRPENIQLDHRDHPKIGGLGQCAVQGAEAPSFRPEPDYAPPDAVSGPAADLYALGVIYYRMLTGKVPYSRVEGSSGGPRSLTLAFPQVDARAIPVAERLVAAHASQRFASAAEVGQALDVALRAPRPGLSATQKKQLAREEEQTADRSLRGSIGSIVALLGLGLLLAAGILAPGHGDVAAALRTLKQNLLATAMALTGALELLVCSLVFRKDLAASGRGPIVFVLLMAAGAAAFTGGIWWDLSVKSLASPAGMLAAGGALAGLGAAFSMRLEEGARPPAAQIVLLGAGLLLWLAGWGDGGVRGLVSGVGAHLGVGLPLVLVAGLAFGFALTMITGRAVQPPTRWIGVAVLLLAGLLLALAGSAGAGGTVGSPGSWFSSLAAAAGRRAAEAPVSGGGLWLTVLLAGVADETMRTGMAKKGN